MPYPVIILGAGASADHVYDNPDSKVKNRFSDDMRPPVTDGLFDHVLTPEILGYYSAISPLPARINSRVHQIGLEDCLSTVKLFARSDRKLQRQLVTLEFFLQHFFDEISSKIMANTEIKLHSNYHALVDSISDHLNIPEDQCCFINFNYDTLLEDALRSNYPLIGRDIDSYIAEEVKVVKLHGSCNWAYLLPYTHPDYDNTSSSYKMLNKNPYYIAEYYSNYTQERDPNNPSEIRDIIMLNRQKDVKGQDDVHRTYRHKDRYLYPAIAIPLTNKEENYENYVCPQKHIDVMKEALSKTDRILIIGWKAGDEELIKLMQKTIKRPVTVMIVSGSLKSIEDIRKKLEVVKHFYFADGIVSFSNFVRYARDSGIVKFLSTSLSGQ